MTPADGVEVWLVDLDRDGARLAAMADKRGLLDAADRVRHRAYRNGADAAAFAASRAALDLVLSRFAPEPLSGMQRGKSGKPYVPGLPMFSLSHTAGYAAVATAAEGAIGVDIEHVADRAPGHALIERIARGLGGAVPVGRRALLAWTVAEAWSKFHGMRLADLLDSAGQGRELEDAISGGGPVLALLDLPTEIIGCCWHMMPGAAVTVRMLDVPGQT